MRTYELLKRVIKMSSIKDNVHKGFTDIDNKEEPYRELYREHPFTNSHLTIRDFVEKKTGTKTDPILINQNRPRFYS